MTATRDPVAVVLARGASRRLRASIAGATLDDAQRAAATAGRKPMVPIAGRPWIDHVLGRVRDAGVSRAIAVVSPEQAADPVGTHPGATVDRLDVELAVQAEPRGTADAVRAARVRVGDAPFVVLNGDNVYPVAALRALLALGGPGVVGFTAEALAGGGIPIERARAFAQLDVERDRLQGIVEKPQQFDPAALVGMNAWRFDARIFDAIDGLAPSPRGEWELPDAVRRSMRAGVDYAVIRSSDPVFDLTHADDVAGLEARLAAPGSPTDG